MQVSRKHKGKNRDKGKDKAGKRKCCVSNSNKYKAVKIAEAVKERLGEDFVSDILVDAVEEVLGYDTSGEMKQVLIDAIEKIDAGSDTAEQALDAAIERLDNENAALIKAIASQTSSRPYAYGKEPGVVCAEKAAADKAKARAFMAKHKAESTAESTTMSEAEAFANKFGLESIGFVLKNSADNWLQFYCPSCGSGLGDDFECGPREREIVCKVCGAEVNISYQNDESRQSRLGSFHVIATESGRRFEVYEKADGKLVHVYLPNDRIMPYIGSDADSLAILWRVLKIAKTTQCIGERATAKISADELTDIFGRLLYGDKYTAGKETPTLHGDDCQRFLTKMCYGNMAISDSDIIKAVANVLSGSKSLKGRSVHDLHKTNGEFSDSNLVTMRETTKHIDLIYDRKVVGKAIIGFRDNSIYLDKFDAVDNKSRAIEMADAIKRRLGDAFIDDGLVEELEEVLEHDFNGVVEYAITAAIKKIGTGDDVTDQALDAAIERLDAENAALIKAIASQEDCRPCAIVPFEMEDLLGEVFPNWTMDYRNMYIGFVSSEGTKYRISASPESLDYLIDFTSISGSVLNLIKSKITRVEKVVNAVDPDDGTFTIVYTLVAENGYHVSFKWRFRQGSGTRPTQCTKLRRRK